MTDSTTVDRLRQRAGFAAMSEGTAEDWAIIGAHFAKLTQGLAPRVLDHLQLLEGDNGGFAVDRLEHSLQTATRASRAGKDDEYVACALLHDIGDTLCSWNHPDAAVAILRPFVSADNLWMIEKHNIFQGYNYFHFIGLDRDMREQFADHPCYQRTVEFCQEFDQTAFDPGYASMSLADFEPLLVDLFRTPKQNLLGQAAG